MLLNYESMSLFYGGASVVDVVNKHALFISPETKSHTHTHRCPYLDADFETRKNTFYEIVKSPDVVIETVKR